MKALIDGDILLYSCGFAAQRTIYSVSWEVDGNECSTVAENKKEADKLAESMKGEVIANIVAEPVENALHNVSTLIEKTLTGTNADSYQVFLTGKGNFREELVDYYKKNRDPTHKPVHYEAIKDYLISRWGAVVVEGMEADDAMSIEQSQALSYPDTCICSIDKDLKNTPGYHYNWNKDDEGVVFISPEESENFFYVQLLTGDPTDNIPGIYKMTNKKHKASKAYKKEVMEKETELEKWEFVKGLYADGGVSEEDLITIARLLWMRREEEEMWEPPVAE